MDGIKPDENNEQDQRLAEQSDESQAIDRAFIQMESIYKSRCVHPPLGSNVTVREIKKDQ
jgi:hypothetical protein